MTPEPIDPRVARKIKDMCKAGVRDVGGMIMVLESYVKDISNPANHRFHPSDKIISYNTYVANKEQPGESLTNLLSVYYSKHFTLKSSVPSQHCF